MNFAKNPFWKTDPHQVIYRLTTKDSEHEQISHFHFDDPPAALAVSGCASTTLKATNPEVAPPEADRQAILNMAGEYVVTFAGV